MEFEKETVFLGYKSVTLKDGTVLYSITLYVDEEPVTVNVVASNDSVLGALDGLSFGTKCVATFALRRMEKLYRLSLTRLANV